MRCEGRGADTEVDVWLQVRCPAVDQAKNGEFSSISGERRPDIVITVKSPTGCRFIVMDAKYRVKRESVLNAMTSAHLYHDSLRWKGHRPDLSVLLVPRGGGVPVLETMEYREKNGVGVVVLSIERDGLRKVLERFEKGPFGAVSE
jgi:hypothetical protein